MPIDVGCIYSRDIQFKQRSDGSIVDVSTWEFEATLRDKDGTALLEMTTGGEHFTAIKGDDGWLIRMSIPAASTTDFTPGPVTAVLYRTDGDRKRFGKFSDIVRAAE